jgi:AbrB family looped-hinge helix DNA binding protein
MEKKMIETTIVSTKYQVVIPKEIREKFQIKPGQKVKFICYNNDIHMVIVPEIKNARGYLKGIDSVIEREEGDRV